MTDWFTAPLIRASQRKTSNHEDLIAKAIAKLVYNQVLDKNTLWDDYEKVEECIVSSLRICLTPSHHAPSSSKSNEFHIGFHLHDINNHYLEKYDSNSAPLSEVILDYIFSFGGDDPKDPIHERIALISSLYNIQKAMEETIDKIARVQKRIEKNDPQALSAAKERGWVD